MHYIGQGSDVFFTANDQPRKIREWTTVDALVSYTFNLAAPVTTENQIAGYAKDGGKTINLKDGKEKSLMPISTAEYNPSGWKTWLNSTTVTVGMNNIFDRIPLSSPVRLKTATMDRLSTSKDDSGMWR